MFKSFYILTALIVLLTAGTGNALPAFPGAEGFGAETPGGRGGKVLTVTNLNDAGTGSLRWAMTQTFPRIIVFAIGGIIDVQSQITPPMGADYFTIAGQTAPGGITLSGGGIGSYYSTTDSVTLHDDVIRHIRIRGLQNTAVGETDGVDCISYYKVRRTVIDHVSTTWACDETIQLMRDRDETVQWTIVGEAALQGEGGCSHPEGDHNYGILLSYDPASNFSVHHTLITSMADRDPLIGDGGETSPIVTDIRNCVVYNCYVNVHMAPHAHVNLIGYYLKPGPSSWAPWWPTMVYLQGGSSDDMQLYFSDNSHTFLNGIDPYRRTPDPTWMYDIANVTLLNTPIQCPAVTTQPVNEGRDLVLAYSGAFPRDSVDRRIVKEVKDSTGKWGKGTAVLQVTGMGTPSPADADKDGMPDCWETANGLNTNDSSDCGQDKDGDGYTNIEEYINDVAEILINKPTANPTGGCIEAVYNPAYNPAMNKWYQPTAREEAVIRVNPNPFSGMVTIECANAPFGSAQGAEMRNARVDIFNVNGVLVYSALRIPNSKILTWSGKDLAGCQAPPGIYMVRLTGANRILATEKIVLVQ